ncbi:TrlF family AAA-like ATPase [Blastococcus sp. LR1]|uniref:TrlF family AAA-like ATPase n=1 Tax=Blastococcus sp. LR1 TaxID=2877000 RepID=UPI001CC9AD4A|nr:AAA family ATPase [Blastococcus sp. LR1]MCA0145487.1 AAA family ATPase [Blastococcus sp. LR1]
MSDGRDRGAHFYRSDLQVHTPRDAAWKGKRPVSVDDRKAYAGAFVAECRRIGLQAVAITDHHDLLFAPLIREAASDEIDPDGDRYPPEEQLVVFPGIELTLALSRQALLILDADFPTDRLPLVLEALAVTPHDPTAPKLPDVVALDHITSLGQLHDILDQRDWLKKRYIVLPNVTDSGHKSVMRKGMQAEYKEMPCVGGYLDGSIEKIGTGNRTILDGKDPNWGSKALALFQTSDSRSETFQDLGRHSTWVKWAEPSAEALRQACLGRESRIAQSEPQLPSVYISRLSVSNSKFLGPADVSFNPQYNAIIGGRGTGKSTLLDYLRWALCDQAADAGDEELANPSVRRRHLIAATLTPVSGQVEVYFTINEIPHVVRRDAATGDILLKVGSEEFAPAREADIRALLPVHAYSQKQLSSVSLRLDELTRFVTAPIKQTLDALDAKVMDVSGRLRENYAVLQRARDLDGRIARSILAEKSLAEQAANLRRSLGGLSDEDRQVLDRKPAVDRVRDALGDWRRDQEALSESGAAYVAEIDRSIRGLKVPEDVPEELRELAEATQRQRRLIFTELRRNVSDALANLEQASAAGSSLQANDASLSQGLTAFETRYEEVKSRSSAHEVKLTELAQIEERRKVAAETLQRQQRDRSGLDDPEATHSRLRQELIEQYGQRSERMARECQRLTELSGGLLRASMSRGRGLDGVEQRFRNLIQGSGVRGARVEQLFSELRKDSDPIGTWEQVLVELEWLMLIGEEGEHTSEITPNLTRLGLPVPDQVRIRGRITPDGWLDLALTPLNDEPVFEYQTREREFIAFSSASAGQQATALLRILLAQTGMPLIIDQPEEDLDSQVIQDVVERIWTAKKGRQLLFVSHNANLVVNGDAELVVACGYRKAGDQSGGRIKLEGAIDVPAVRDEITQVMEGGEKAFKLRKEKYGF